MGRDTMGVIGMSLREDDEVVGMQLDHQGGSLLVVTSNGIGKRTAISEFPVHHRGSKGIKCYKITEKTGDIIGVKAVNDDHEIMMITSAGIIIQIRMADVRVMGRDTSGVKLINLDEGTTVSQIAKVREKISDENGAEESIDEVLDEVLDEVPDEELPEDNE